MNNIDRVIARLVELDMKAAEYLQTEVKKLDTYAPAIAVAEEAEEPEHLILGSLFVWSESPQGHEYWSALANWMDVTSGHPQNVFSAIAQWHEDRNLIDGSSDKAQMVKLMEEVGELAGSIAKGKDITDDIGDIMVVLVNICERNKLDIMECAKAAYDEISPRRGRMVKGIFVKEEEVKEKEAKEVANAN